MEAAEMRSGSMSYRQIASAFSVDVHTAVRMVERGWKLVPTENLKVAKAVELDKLDMIERRLVRVMLSEHVKVDHGKVIMDEYIDDQGIMHSRRMLDDGPVIAAARALILLSESRRKIVSINAPVQVNVRTITEDALDAELRKFSEEVGVDASDIDDQLRATIDSYRERWGVGAAGEDGPLAGPPGARQGA